ncbi:hypothetical protein RM697_00290 [Ichthyenterobacterium sp. W332]|uniref:Uncharacterized protein n=1 Tax=Microcosmobacter mediterraneus TaxID=3075607 RepID=A0ABU2YFV1_9FLAO|nr:hypothetical protein [Ichthyenterobacterium sp. W332]MDT0557061.1 hypothetical protein [Ichthyenterobacterium sp. W332]
MLKFFRRIRYDLMSTNKSSKYFKYAIGEIILVVIGILIALAISNWNSNRLNKQRNAELLVKLSKELDQNIARCNIIDTVNNGFKDRLKFTDSALVILNKGITADDLDFLTSKRIYYTATLNLNTSVFEELKNTGSLYAIGSDNLVSAIQNYYQLCERESFYNLELSKDILIREEKCIEGWFNFNALYRQNKERAIAINPWIFNPSSKDYLFFKQYIGYVRGHSNMMVHKLEGIVEASKKLKQLISEEIELN